MPLAKIVLFYEQIKQEKKKCEILQRRNSLEKTNLVKS